MNLIQKLCLVKQGIKIYENDSKIPYPALMDIDVTIETGDTKHNFYN